MPQTPVRHSHWLCDAAFLAFAAIYAFLAMMGIQEISAMGAILDSDLQTYAQGMAGEAAREYFLADPVLSSHNAANSIPNIQRQLGVWLAPDDNWASGLLRSGSLAIFVFYAGWYCLGRYLYGSPSLAAILSLCCGITVWVGWGTFWGITHSDPVPRVFFAAFMPFLLILALSSMERPILRPLAMLCAGSAIWAHGISALNFGAMLFTAFMFFKPDNVTAGRHLINLAACLGTFFLPVLIFLWPSLIQSRQFSTQDLALFNEIFRLRWSTDYSGFAQRLVSFFNYSHPAFPIMACGVAGWGIVLSRGGRREKLAARVFPAFILGLFLVTAFCWLETSWAARFGRLPMGHELVRGLRFIVPLSWIMAIAGLGCIAGLWFRRLILVVVICLLAIYTGDRQYAAAQYAISGHTGLPMPLYAQAASQKLEAEKYREVLNRVKELVPPGEKVFAFPDAMPVRYVSMRPLAYAFKDGYVHFYNKDLEGSREWLNYAKACASPEGCIKTWAESDAPWLLCPDGVDSASLLEHGKIALRLNGWLLVHKN